MDSTSTSGKMSGNGSDKAGQHRLKTDNGDARDKLISEMKAVIGEAEQWLERGSAETGDAVGAVQLQFQETLQTAKNDLLRLETTLLAKTRVAAQATDAYVQEHPWTAVGLGATLGVLIGLFISRE